MYNDGLHCRTVFSLFFVELLVVNFMSWISHFLLLVSLLCVAVV